jgi:lysine 6-dehydrogenase
MGPFSYFITGCGVGKAIAYYLSRQESTRLVVLGDMNRLHGAKAVKSINSATGKNNCLFTSWNADKEKVLNGFDVVISALPARYNYKLAKQSILMGSHFCDLGGIIAVTEEMQAGLNERAVNLGLSVVPDLGIMPGLGIMITKMSVEKFDSVENAVIYVGGIPQKPRPPMNYQKMFNIDGIEAICFDDAPILRNGKIVYVKPLTERQTFKIPELTKYSPGKDGMVEAFLTAGASVAHHKFNRMGVKNFCEKTVRWPGFCDYVSKLKRSQFREVVDPLISIPVDQENPDILWMRVEVEGKKTGLNLSAVTEFLDFYDPKTNLTAMERSTGFPAALAAMYLADKRVPSGVNTPEKAFTSEQVNDQLSVLKEDFTIKQWFTLGDLHHCYNG